MGAASNQDSFYVPTINIAPFLQDAASQESAEIIKDVRRACISTGFFQITGHGIPKDLQQSVFEASAHFFGLPFDEKLKLDCRKQVGYRGYDVLASQSYEQGVMPDRKEGYYIGSDIPSTHPLHGRFFSGPNVWPDDDLLTSTQFRSPCERYFESLHALALIIVDLVGASLLLDTNGEKRATSQSNGKLEIPSVLHDIAYLDPVPACPMRLLHYPAKSPAVESSSMPQYGASAHIDFSAITLLLQDENPGLEVLDTSPSALATGKNIWRPIDPNPEAYVVNMGAIISKITGDVYKASIHRVICKRPDRDRYSLVFFLDGCLDAKLGLVDSPIVDKQAGHDGRSDQTVEQHMIERLTMSYDKDAKKDMRREGETFSDER